ncbi:hypothetical protein RM572_05970 [Streptomyces sp. DSM 42041]|uniref:DUF6571 domain-containing protein n=1 Tax=Streptomyces hazeniae TaxID=3075538 RepID=A0ABU2NMX8_9ACTN|nr:DUF6571 family protein [Streptomyces sp. DSM 42041]MDT0378326.1 hypothetical protein [Streptomyces sp. DSM 42041]
MNYEQLDQADLSGLEQAAKDWRSVKSAYEGLGDDYDQRVRRRLERSWEGEAAAAAQSEIVQVKKQMDAAAGEAGRMAKLLDDIHHDLHEFQKQLRTLEGEMQEKHLQVGGNGAISDHHPTHQDKAARHDPGMDDWRAGRQRLVNRYAEKIDDILRKATAADETAETALKADRNGEEDDTFTKAGHTTLEQVAQAEKDAERAAELMKGRASPTELSELNKLLSKHGNDPVFAEKFARTRGADGTLQSYMTMMNPPPGSGHDQKELLKKIQKNLGTTLGTATTVDSRAMDRFEKDLMAAGDNDYHSSGGRAGTHDYNGYQLTSSLMANGEWDSGFLNDFGTELIKEEQDRYQFWGSDRESHWGGGGSALDLITSDPMVGFSDALGHNPEAATDFLSGSTDTDDGKVDNLDYLLKDREWHGGDGDKAHLGHALEAATTGHAYDVNPPNPSPPHTEQQATIFKDVIGAVSENRELATDGMSDSLGQMAGEYMPDLNRAFFNDEELATKIMPSYGAPAELSQDEASRFLYAVSCDPQGYAAITLGENQYTASVMAHHAENPGALQVDPADEMYEISRATGLIDGIAANAKSDEIIRSELGSDQQYNDALERGGKWAEALISVGGAAVGGGAGGPAGAAIGAAAGAEVAKIVVGEVTGSAQDTTIEGSDDAAREYAKAEEASHNNIWKTMKEADVGPPAGMTMDEWRLAIERGVSDGYRDAHSNVDMYATNRPEGA